MSLFKGILKFVTKPVAFVAKTAGALVGLPALGVGVSNLIKGIGGAPKVTQMAVAAAASGAVDTAKVAQTLVAAGIPDTKENVTQLSQALPVIASANTSISTVNKPSELPLNDTAGKLTVTFKLWDYIKKYWYLALPSGLLVVYLVYKSFKK